MTLEDVLVVADENIAVHVADFQTAWVLAIYDGRDSIPSKYNTFEVKRVSVSINGRLWIFVDA